MPTLVMTGSARTQATSRGAKASSSAVEVVELDDVGELGQVARLADECRIGTRASVPQADKGFIDGTVIAAVEDEDLACGQ